MGWGGGQAPPRWFTTGYWAQQPNTYPQASHTHRHRLTCSKFSISPCSLYTLYSRGTCSRHTGKRRVIHSYLLHYMQPRTDGARCAQCGTAGRCMQCAVHHGQQTLDQPHGGVTPDHTHSKPSRSSRSSSLQVHAGAPAPHLYHPHCCKLAILASSTPPSLSAPHLYHPHVVV